MFWLFREHGWGLVYQLIQTDLQIEKYEGSYNIVDNTINFYTAPSGLKPAEGTDPDDH